MYLFFRKYDLHEYLMDRILTKYTRYYFNKLPCNKYINEEIEYIWPNLFDIHIENLQHNQHLKWFVLYLAVTSLFTI